MSKKKTYLISWRIHTEAINTDGIIAETIKHGFVCANFTKGTGLWHNTLEESFTIEIIGTISEESAINNLAKSIQVLNSQQAVLVTGFELLTYNLIS